MRNQGRWAGSCVVVLEGRRRGASGDRVVGSRSEVLGRTMSVSSRTPEGIPNRCPVCGKQVVLEPSDPAGDAPCSHCGHLLWFTDTGGHETMMERWPEGRSVFVVDKSDFDAAAAVQLAQDALRDEAAPHLVLDFSRLGFLSSAALGKLMALHQRARGAGGSLKLRNLRPEIHELFRITKLDRLFEIEHG